MINYLDVKPATASAPVSADPEINTAFREGIVAIEERIKSIPGAVIGDNELCPLKHSFADGVYVREIFIPAGTLIVGKIHKHSHPNFISSGRVAVMTEEGPKEIVGPCTMISPAGTKRLVYAYEDTVWTTIHVTDKINLEEIEEEIISKSYEEYDQLTTSKFVEMAVKGELS